MVIPSGLLVSVLAVSLTMLPSECHGFAGTDRPVPAPATAQGSTSCSDAKALPCERTAAPAYPVVPLPLPRPPDLGQSERDLPDCPCARPKDER